ncbi:MAG TPA: sodium:proton antiporter [Candidatus Aphodovivens excrementavium]|nr:sodium:proton antiporter [Candidatus Aphodovivens excrementavium]
MELLELVLFLLVAIVASSLLDQIVRGVSLPLVQIAIGAAVAFAIPTSLTEGIDFELLFVLFIAPLHFNESRHANSSELWRNRWGIASLVTGLVLLVMVSVGFSLHALLPAIPLAACLAVGAAMGSSDATAITSLSKDFRFGKRHEALLTGEALLNDVTGTVGFTCAIGVAVSGSFSLAHAGEEFALDLFGGMVAGLVLGFLFWLLLLGVRKFGLENPTVHVVLELLVPFVIYLACEQLHLGGVIAVVMAGMMLSLLPQKRTASTARQRLQSASVWKTLEFVLNGIIFVVLGMQLPRVLTSALDGGLFDAAGFVGVVLALTLVLEAVRFVWILGMDVVDMRCRGGRVRLCFTRPAIKSALAMTFAGSKGGVTLALILTIPLAVEGGAAFPYRAELLSLASGVILCTLLLANFALRLLAPRKAHEKRSRPYVDAEIVLLERVIAFIQHDSAATGAVREAGAPASSGPVSLDELERYLDEARERVAKAQAAERERLEGASVGVSSGPSSTAGEAAAERGVLSYLPEEVDEPATAIVMKRYADRIAELAPHASPEVGARGLALAARVEELFDTSDALAEALREIERDENEDAEGIGAHMLALDRVREAVIDIQDQALSRELECIKGMRRAGELSNAHARDLRNDVYVQQMIEG